MMKLFRVAIFASLFFASNQQPADVPDLPVAEECWTNWFDIDDPRGSGDFDTLCYFHKNNPGKICKSPLAAESDTTTGFNCRNNDQKEKSCHDYRVRFRCPPSFCEVKVCWTEWFNGDDPQGTGDFETLISLFRENPGEICPSPLAMEAQTVTGLSVAEAGDVIYENDLYTGFICRNNNQKKKICNDYHVRFSCPASFCDVKVCWTQWFNRDDPSGSGDLETLDSLHKENPGKICPSPVAIEAQTLTGLSVAESGDVIYKNDPDTGFICRNDDQKEKSCNDYRVRFSCPPPYCEVKVCWTQWFDQDDPCALGDWETLPRLHEEYPAKICEKPLDIEAVTIDTNTPSTSTGDIIFLSSPTGGFVCRNQDQKSGQCHDYKVRFWCPC